MTTVCKQCGSLVQWVKIDGRLHCYNSGTNDDHWDSCSQRRFENIKKTGEHFKNEVKEGYVTDLKPSGVQLVMDSSKPITGKYYVPSEHSDECVPWEDCICGGGVNQ